MKKYQKKSLGKTVGNTPFLVFAFFCYAVLLHGKELNKDDSSQKLNDPPPSIFFIIDNSGSMYNGPDASDSVGNRFNVTRDLVDTLRMKSPDAEVGISVFGTYLYFDPVDDLIFKQCPQQDSGAYIPLLKLDSAYAPSGEMGWQILKRYLDTTLVTEPIFGDHVALEYVPTATNLSRGNTNINAGFDAAKHAFLSSQFEKENHYIIFLSDGEATYPEDGTMNDFVEGADVPTTFTIFFTSDGTTPQTIQDMTTNIQNNGYSTSNPESNLWAFENTNYDSLMTFIMEKILGFITDDKAPKLIAYTSPTYERRPLLKWNKPIVAGSNYTIQIDSVNSFNAPIITVPVVDTFYTPSIDLPVGTIYWRVKSDISSWSQTGSFIILDNRVPALIPYTPEITNNTTPTLKWRSVASASSYTIEVDNNSDFSSPILTMPIADTSYIPSAPLPFGDIYWHVKSDLIDTWSVADHFFILADSIPFLLRFNGQTISNPRPEFKWNPVAGATSYKILIADNSDFNNAITFPLTDTICILQTDLALGKWFWKVSCSKDLELYSPVDSLEIVVTGLLPEISQHTGQGIRFIQSHKNLRIILGTNNSKNVIADIYNINGRIISTLTTDNNKSNVLHWNFSDRQGMAVPSGMYVVRVKAGDRVHAKRVIVSK